MTKRTRRFLVVGVAILVVGLGTGLFASYVGVPTLGILASAGPAELAYVPADARMVAFANVREVMDSEVRQKLLSHMQPGGQGAQQFEQETGIDVQRDVDSVVAAFAGGSGTQPRPIFLVRGKFNPSLIEAAIRTKGGSVEEYNGERLVSFNGEMGVAFVEPDLAAVGSPADVKRAIDTKASGTNVTSNADVMRLVKDVDSGTAWAVAQFDALTGGHALPSDVSKQLPPINWFAFTGHIDGGVRGMVRAETRDEASANDLRDVIRGFVALARMQAGQKAEFADLMNSFELGGQGNTVTLGFAVPAEMIDALGSMQARRPRAPAPNPNQLPGAAPRRPLPGL